MIPAFTALCALARLHHVAADPAALAHQFALASDECVDSSVLIRAARHIGLRAKLTCTSTSRLARTPLPAIAVLQSGEPDPAQAQPAPRYVVLAKCDGQRVLIQDPSTPEARPTLESIGDFARRWTGELILVSSRASLMGDLAKFDFSWFIPSLVKHRRLLGEVLAISFMLQLFALVSPLFFQVVMDKVLVHRGLTTLDVLIIGLVVVVLFESLLSGLRAYIFSHTTSRIDVELGARLFAICCSCRSPTSRPGAWAIRWRACASWKASAAFSPAMRSPCCSTCCSAASSSPSCSSTACR